jgi:hypothetical protein
MFHSKTRIESVNYNLTLVSEACDHVTNHDKSDLPGNLSVSESSKQSKEFCYNFRTGLRLNIRHSSELYDKLES